MVMNRLGRTTDTAWVSLLAEQLICEIADQMGAIRLSCERSVPRCEADNREMSVMSARVGGDYSISIYFVAEHSLFVRLARNMLGKEPEEEDVHTYAGEFFNIVCGRFISELINKADISVRLMPVDNEPQNAEKTLNEKLVKKLHFISDMKEYAVFSWTYLPIEEMLRRGMSE